MTKRLHRGLIYILTCLIAGFLGLEAALRFVDPVGVYRYFADYNALAALSLPAPEGFHYIAGTHRFAMYTVTIDANGLRHVSGNRGGDCIIAFVGDSVTFGMGSDTSFVNLLAPDIDATVINAAMPGYSAGNVARSIDMHPVEGYVWLIIQNDDDPAYVWQRPTGGGIPSAFTLYLGYWLPGAYVPPKRNEQRFVEMAAPVLARDDVLAFVFNGHALTDLVRREFPSVIPIENYTETVSRFDAHPNAAGAGQIASAIHDTVIEFTTRQCE